MQQEAEDNKEAFREQMENEADKFKNDATLMLKETINVDNLLQASAEEPTVPQPHDAEKPEVEASDMQQVLCIV